MPEVGEHWAYREKPRTPGGELRPVEVLQIGPPTSRKVRIRWLDGEFHGLDQWVSMFRLVVTWSDVDEFLIDEKNHVALLASQPDPLEDVVLRAVDEIYLATRASVELEAAVGRPLSASVVDFNERPGRLPIPDQDLLESPGAFVDSAGTLHIGQGAALALARALCHRYSAEVLDRSGQNIAEARRAVATGWIDPGLPGFGPYKLSHDAASDRLRREQGIDAVLREWCGAGPVATFDEREELRSELKRLRSLIESTASFLQFAGHPVKARLLLRELRTGGPPVSGG